MIVLIIWLSIVLFNCFVIIPYWHIKERKYMSFDFSNNSELFAFIFFFGMSLCFVPLSMFLFQIS